MIFFIFFRGLSPTQFLFFIFRLMLNFITIYFYHTFIKNKLVNSIMEFVTQFVTGLKLIQYIIILMVFVKKIIILKFYQKVSYVFINY